jgi:hypothetical protein
MMYDLELSRQHCIIKSSRATSRVKWLKYENTDVSRAITALVLRTTYFNHLTRLVAREDFIIKPDVSKIGSASVLR